MTDVGEYPDPNTVSECCAEPMYSQSTRCPKCQENTGTMSMKEDIIDFYITIKFSTTYDPNVKSYVDLIDLIRDYRQDLENISMIEYARLVNFHVNGKCPSDMKEFMKEANK